MDLIFPELESTERLVSQRGVTMHMRWYGDTHTDRPDRPQLHWVELLHDSNAIPSHYHSCDQFQLFVDSDGWIGSHPLTSLFLHYADAYTPYGPIRPRHTGLRFLTARACRDKGVRYIADPGALEHRRGRGGRQFTLDLRDEFPRPGSPSVLLHEEPDGVAVRLSRVGPGDSLGLLPLYNAVGPLICLVLAGGLAGAGRAYRRSSYMALTAGELAPSLLAEDSGADVLLLSFRPVESGSDLEQPG